MGDGTKRSSSDAGRSRPRSRARVSASRARAGSDGDERGETTRDDGEDGRARGTGRRRGAATTSDRGGGRAGDAGKGVSTRSVGRWRRGARVGGGEDDASGRGAGGVEVEVPCALAEAENDHGRAMEARSREVARAMRHLRALLPVTVDNDGTSTAKDCFGEGRPDACARRVARPDATDDEGFDAYELAAGLGILMHFTALASRYLDAPRLHRGSHAGSQSFVAPTSAWTTPMPRCGERRIRARARFRGRRRGATVAVLTAKCGGGIGRSDERVGSRE